MPSLRRPAARVRSLAVALVLVVLGLSLTACSTDDPAATASSTGPVPTGAGSTPARAQVRVLAEHPHDPAAFTQGLVWAGDGELFESTGLRGQSSLRRVTLASGAVEQQHDLDAPYFGEGLAQVGDRLVQLTWQEGTAFSYDAPSFQPVGTFSYAGEGWGLCYDGARLVMTDGSSTLTFRDPDSFEIAGTVEVTDAGEPLEKLNELECVGDHVFANVLTDDHIYEIDPATGAVVTVIDASALSPASNRARGDVLNGIAYDPDTRHYYITGKRWPTLYEVVFEPTA